MEANVRFDDETDAGAAHPVRQLVKLHQHRDVCMNRASEVCLALHPHLPAKAKAACTTGTRTLTLFRWCQTVWVFLVFSGLPEAGLQAMHIAWAASEP